MSGASVTFRLANGSGSWIFSGTTDSAGVFRGRLVNAPNGPYTVTVTSVNAAGTTWVRALDRDNPLSFTK